MQILDPLIEIDGNTKLAAHTKQILTLKPYISLQSICLIGLDYLKIFVLSVCEH